MREEQKKTIKERYEQSLQKGERFWPDSIFKDVLMALAIFVLLLMLATFVGVPVEPKADPSDSSYVPRPEWYFLFLFKFLALYGQIPLLGKVEWLATVLIPVIYLGALTLLPFIDRSPNRYYGKRVFAIGIMAIMVTSMVSLTFISDVPTTSTDAVYLPGLLQTLGGLVVPLAGYFLLALMNFAFKKAPAKAMIWTTAVTVLLMIGLTAGTVALAPILETVEVEVADTLEEQIVAGQDLYSVHCVECHGDDGSVTVIEGVEGLEGTQVMAINGRDVLYTLNDDSMAEVIAYGRPDAGMNPFGRAYNPEGLTKSEIDYIVIFMRYAWDDRYEMPPMEPLFPALAEGEAPSYEVHIAPIVKRYCVSCHRAGKDNLNYLMTTYEEVLTSGDHADQNIIAGDPQSFLLLTIQEQTIPDPETGEEMIGVMPPKKALSADIVDVFLRWIMNGMPETAGEAGALSTMPAATATP
ncbi:MAG: hypothetical protein FJZ96_04745 [Chloroflexi bacterium]|nr:hypothetical protein [Chloroflexota bacterium]